MYRFPLTIVFMSSDVMGASVESYGSDATIGRSLIPKWCGEGVLEKIHGIIPDKVFEYVRLYRELSAGGYLGIKNFKNELCTTLKSSSIDTDALAKKIDTMNRLKSPISGDNTLSVDRFCAKSGIAAKLSDDEKNMVDDFYLFYSTLYQINYTPKSLKSFKKPFCSELKKKSKASKDKLTTSLRQIFAEVSLTNIAGASIQDRAIRYVQSRCRALGSQIPADFILKTVVWMSLLGFDDYQLYVDLHYGIPELGFYETRFCGLLPTQGSDYQDQMDALFREATEKVAAYLDSRKDKRTEKTIREVGVSH